MGSLYFFVIWIKVLVLFHKKLQFHQAFNFNMILKKSNNTRKCILVLFNLALMYCTCFQFFLSIFRNLLNTSLNSKVEYDIFTWVYFYQAFKSFLFFWFMMKKMEKLVQKESLSMYCDDDEFEHVSRSTAPFLSTCSFRYFSDMHFYLFNFKWEYIFVIFITVVENSLVIFHNNSMWLEKNAEVPGRCILTGWYFG